MEFRLLGCLEVDGDGGRKLIKGPRQRALLALLLIRLGRVVPFSDLAAELWADGRRPSSRNALHAHVARLKHTLGKVALFHRSAGYVLEADDEDLDVTRFHGLRRRANALRAHDPRQAMAEYRLALSLWRGPALQDACLGPLCYAAAARLDEARIQAQEDLADLYLRLGEPSLIIDDLRELASLHPLRETLHERLISALYLSGRRAEAMTTYMRVRQRLQEELGTEPSRTLRQRYLEILRDERN